MNSRLQNYHIKIFRNQGRFTQFQTVLIFIWNYLKKTRIQCDYAEFIFITILYLIAFLANNGSLAVTNLGISFRFRVGQTSTQNDGEDGYVSILTYAAFNQKRVEKMSHILCLGYKKGEGLGPNSKGIVNPVIPDTRYHGQHIGWDSQKNIFTTRKISWMREKYLQIDNSFTLINYLVLTAGTHVK